MFFGCAASFPFASLNTGRRLCQPVRRSPSVILSALFLRSSKPGGLLVWCVVGFFAGIGLFFYGFRLLQRRRLILDTPFSRIRSASLGMVEVSGLAVGPYTMIAPITARPCYYYRTQVFEWKQRGKNSEWVKVAGECMHVPFFVDDNTGRMLVDPRGADLDLHRDFQQEFNGSFFSNRDMAPPNVVSFLARHGVATSNKIKVEECCIKPKNSLFILGTLAENPGIEIGPQPIRDAEPVSSFTPQGFSLTFSVNESRDQFATGSPNYQLALQHDARRMPQVTHIPSSFGSPPAGNIGQEQTVADALRKAGISNPAAWAAARVFPAGGSTAGAATAAVQVIADAAASIGGGNPNSAVTAPALDPHPPVALMKGTNNKTFLISWRSQQEIARSLGWKCTLMIWGGPPLTLLSLYLFLSIERLL